VENANAVSVRLVQCTAAELIAALPDGCVDLVLLDPPWLYGKAGVPGHGKADDHYGGMPVGDILNDCEALARVCRPDAWCVVWVTFPLLAELFGELYMRLTKFPFEYMTGGSWHKIRAKRGIGHHVLGDAEMWTLWHCGKPKTREQFSNARSTRPLGHSQKPVVVARDHVQAWSDPGGLVLDPYAGEFATFAKVCLREGRRYLGAEPDRARFDRAQKILDHFREISAS
jgi:hypothetical protein